MKLQKSIITLAIAATLSASVFTLPALAADNTQASTQFTYTKQNDPTYTVSIPSSLSLTDEGTPLTITASDVAYLNGKKVSVTIAGSPKTSPIIRLALFRPTPGNFRMASKSFGILPP